MQASQHARATLLGCLQHDKIMGVIKAIVRERPKKIRKENPKKNPDTTKSYRDFYNNNYLLN
jgi:hypothetical protein